MRLHPALVAVGATVLLTTACGPFGGAGGDAATPSGASTAGGATTGGSSGTTTGTATAEKVDLAGALGHQTVAAPAEGGGTVDLDLLSLKVDGPVTVLRVAFTPHGVDGGTDGRVSIYEVEGEPGLVTDPVLTDVDHLKQYRVLRKDGVVRWETDDVAVDTTDGVPMVGTYYFAAPQDDISTIDVSVADFWPSFTDVPVQR